MVDKLIVAPLSFMQIVHDVYKEQIGGSWFTEDENGNILDSYFMKTNTGKYIANFPKIHNIYLKGSPAEQASADASLGDWSQHVKNTSSVTIIREAY